MEPTSVSHGVCGQRGEAGRDRKGQDRASSLWISFNHFTVKLRCLLPGYTSNSQIMGIHQRPSLEDSRQHSQSGGSGVGRGGHREGGREGVEIPSILFSACRGFLDVVSAGCPLLELGPPLLAIESVFCESEGFPVFWVV